MAAYTGVSFTVVAVYTDATRATMADIYTDVGMTLPKQNPFYSFGNYSFHATAGQYVQIGDFTRTDPWPPVTFAELPDSPSVGMQIVVTDAALAVWGATITGGGANTVLAFYNGTNWTVSAT